MACLERKYGIPLFIDAGMIRIGRKFWQIGSMTGLRARGCRGICLNPTKKDVGFIAVSSHLKKKTPMRREAIIHETLHAAMPKSTERQVERAANAIRKSLAIMGE